MLILHLNKNILANREEHAGFIDPPAEHVLEVRIDTEIGVGGAVERLHVHPQFGAEVSVETQQSRSSSWELALMEADMCTFSSEEIRSVVESFNVLSKKVKEKWMQNTLLRSKTSLRRTIHVSTATSCQSNCCQRTTIWTALKVTIFEVHKLKFKHAASTVREIKRLDVLAEICLTCWFRYLSVDS